MQNNTNCCAYKSNYSHLIKDYKLGLYVVKVEGVKYIELLIR